MRPYFEKMPGFGKPLRENRIARSKDSRASLEAVEAGIAALRKEREKVGIPTETINARGGLTIWQRLEYLVDPGTWHPLHSLYNPEENEEGTTTWSMAGKIAGLWAVIIGFDNKVPAGAWIAGQPDYILRVTDLAKRLHIPLVSLVNCSGVKLPDQEKFYAGRRGSGAPFFRHAELEQAGIPILAGIYGTNPAGGGYQGITPTILIAHKDANIAVGGAGIVSGMSPRGGFDAEGLEQLISVTRDLKERPPGRVETHYNETGFFTHVCDEERGVLDGIKNYMRAIPAYDPMFFRVAAPAEPALPAEDLYHLLPFNQKEPYVLEEILARVVDGSEHLEFRPDYGPEIYTGLVKIDGMLIGVIGNRNLSRLSEYADTRHRRQAVPPGLIKMSEFVTLRRDRVPVIRLQDTSGIDVGDGGKRAARPRRQPGVFDPAGGRADDARRAAQGQRRGALHHGWTDGQPTERVHARHCRHRDLRDARRDRGGRHLRAPRRQGQGCRQAARADRREDERDGAEVLRDLAAGLVRTPWPRGRDRRPEGAARLPAGLRRQRVPEPEVDLPRHQMLLRDHGG